MGHVIFGGLFEPGTSVALYQVPSDEHLTEQQGLLVGRRLADVHGSVGFDGLEVGVRLIASGFNPNGQPHRIRAVALEDDGANSVAAQPQIGPAPTVVGTGEVTVPREAPGAPFAILHTGVPDSLAA